MYRLLVAIALVLPLSGCGTALGVRWESYRDRPRQPAYSINCSGRGHTWDHCHRRAADRCGVKEYIVISLTGDGGVTVSASKSHRVAKAKKNRSMKFRCK
mgnify:CR=1 FL=1